jgi:hypothetical protein
VFKNNLILYNNGFTVRRIDSDYALKFKTPNNEFNYCGIEGDNWPLDKYSKYLDKKEIDYVNEYIKINIESKSENSNYVAVCNDIPFLNRYIEDCIKADINVDVIYCETEKPFPTSKVSTNNNDFVFLGYDYAYPYPDYYSCIYQDIRRIREMNIFNLNQYGLFSTITETTEFIRYRDELKKTTTIAFEQGDFIVYKVWRFTGEFPIHT